MGNLCTNGNGTKVERVGLQTQMGSQISKPPTPNSGLGSEGGSRPPRDLTSLLQDIKARGGVDASPWGDRYRQFLRDRGQIEMESILSFVLDCNDLKAIEEELNSSSNARRKSELSQERLDLLQVIGEKYFSVDSDTQIPLSNQVLQEELGEDLSLPNVESMDASQLVVLVLQARDDNKVWKSGLDQSYRTFILQPTPVSLTACLLSIL